MASVGEPRCDRCRFWERTADVVGECRHTSPRIALGLVIRGEGVQSLQGVWPETGGDKWCGDYAPALGAEPVLTPEADRELWTRFLEEAPYRVRRIVTRGPGAVDTIAGLTKLQGIELIGRRGFGGWSLRWLKTWLAAHGLCLEEGTPP